MYLAVSLQSNATNYTIGSFQNISDFSWNEWVSILKISFMESIILPSSCNINKSTTLMCSTFVDLIDMQVVPSTGLVKTMKLNEIFLTVSMKPTCLFLSTIKTGR